MMDACTGKICSMQRVAILSRSNNLTDGGRRLYNGPLGASFGNENGASIHTSVAEYSMPAATAVNDGARRGIKILKDAGKILRNAGKSDSVSDTNVANVAIFATKLRRTMNGELGGIESPNSDVKGITPITSAVDGICAYDGHLRCSLVALWQWLWPKGCIAVSRVQKENELSNRFKPFGADNVMMTEVSEKVAALTEHSYCNDLRKITAREIDRQSWRGEMAKARKEEVAASKDGNVNAQEFDFPLRTVPKDDSWKQGGWVASAASARRKDSSDGGSLVKKINVVKR